MQALKALVVGMGILIAVAVTAIGYGLMKKSENPEFKFFGGGDAALSPAPAAGAGLAPFGDISLGLPESCRIETARLRRSLLVVQVGPASAECDRVTVVDLKTGRVLGSVRAH